MMNFFLKMIMLTIPARKVVAELNIGTKTKSFSFLIKMIIKSIYNNFDIEIITLTYLTFSTPM